MYLIVLLFHIKRTVKFLKEVAIPFFLILLRKGTLGGSHDLGLLFLDNLSSDIWVTIFYLKNDLFIFCKKELLWFRFLIHTYVGLFFIFHLAC